MNLLMKNRELFHLVQILSLLVNEIIMQFSNFMCKDLSSSQSSETIHSLIVYSIINESMNQ